MYTRASASDYDDWENVYKNPGWGSKHLISLLKKVVLGIHLPSCVNSHCTLIAKAETYQSDEPFDHAIHGTSGPIKISLAGDQINVPTEFLAVAAEYDKERGLAKDANDFTTCNAYGVSGS
jgi:alcohol oxidase